MKITLSLAAWLIYFTALGQKKETYYDFHWKPCPSENASFYSILEKTDSGWLRKDYFLSTKKLQMQALYEDEACKIKNGNAWYYYPNGYPSIISREIHGKKEGVCVSYYSNGMISDSALYHNGLVVDKKFSWYRNEYMSDSICRMNDSTEVEVGWFDDGRVSSAGYLVNGKQSGKWKYFYHSGQLSSLELYKTGNLLSAQYFDEQGQPQMDTSNINLEANFKGGINAWKRYLEKNLYWPTDLQFTTPASVTVGIDFVIDEDGKLADVEVSVPFHPVFDKIALDIVKKSPPWIPAISYNRKVKAYRRQPITFAQPN